MTADFLKIDPNTASNASLVDFERGKINCTLCVIKVAPQIRPTIKFKWQIDNYKRHFWNAHPEYAVRKCSVVLDIFDMLEVVIEEPSE